MDEYLIQETTLSELANAIREKNKTSTLITAEEMGELIQNIPDEYILTNDESLLLEGTITNYFNSKATQVRSYCFYSNSIIKEVSFPNCTIIKERAFYNCNNLNKVTFPKVQMIEASAFNECKNITTINFPQCVSIKDWAFDGCSNLISIYLPECSEINYLAFGYCTNLQNVNLSKCINIGEAAFRTCINLPSICLPNCQTIGEDAFYGCSLLSVVELPGNSVAKLIDDYAFMNTPIFTSSLLGYYGSIYVPASLVSLYKTASAWSRYSSRITSF